MRACYAALTMQDAIRRYADQMRQRDGIDIQIRVGLNSGEVVVRAISNDLHVDYSRDRARPPTSPRAWSSWPRPARILVDRGDRCGSRKGCVAVQAARADAGQGPREPVEVFELVGAGPTPARASRPRPLAA